MRLTSQPRPGGTRQWLPDIVGGAVRTFRVLLHEVTELARGGLWFAAGVRAAKLTESRLLASERELLSSNDRFAIAADCAGIGIWQYHPAGKTLTWDPRMYSLHGYPPGSGTVPYSLWAERLHPEDRARCEAQVDAAARGEREYESEYRIVRPDGQIRHIKAASRTRRAADGTTLTLTGVNLDITEQRQAEQSLRETSSLLRSVLDSASEVSIIATDPGMTVTLFNAGAERLLGYRSEEIIGHTTLLQLHDAEEVRRCSAELSAYLGRDVEGGAIFMEPSTFCRAREWTYLRKDGGRVTVSLVITPMRSDAGALLGYVGVARDVTRQKDYETSLHVAMQKADQANAAKSVFLANMSHEIRTPMNIVIGLTYLLEQTPLNAEQAAYLKQINVASNLLLAVITDVLDLSKIEAGELQIATAAFSPQRLLDGLASIMSVQAAAKGIALEFDMPEGLPAALLGDAPRLTQILTNLLSNAIKFTERGGVSLSVRPIATSATGVTLRFTVKDTGIGIEAAAQARLFTPFVQVDESIARRYGGTGLGLSIVNNLAKLLGGRVTVSSSPGVGSEFCVELAFALAAAAELSTRQPSAATPATRTLAGVRVLVVDDSELNLTVTKRILEHHGSHVELAHDGPDALQLLRASPGGFDVVLMDVQMPILDGYETTRRVRTELGLVNLPIIALTAGALSSESRRAAAVGMNGFIIKPFDAPGLINTIKRHARLAKAGVAVPQPGPAARPVTVATATTAAATATATAQGDGWPHIDGIDTADARGRWCGDLPLFRTMLGQWLKEFSGVTLPAEAIDAESLSTTHAARMHKLRGGACMLGATALQRLAAEAEAACVAGEAARAAQIVVQLAAELERLQIAAASAFAAAPATLERGFPAADGGPEPVALAALVAMLRQNRLSARDRFRDSAPQLKRLLGEKGFLRVRAQIDNLEFDAAADALEAAA